MSAVQCWTPSDAMTLAKRRERVISLTFHIKLFGNCDRDSGIRRQLRTAKVTTQRPSVPESGECK